MNKQNFPVLAMILALAAVFPGGVLAGGTDISGAVVKVFTVFNNPDYDQPWQMTGERSSSGSGCIISGNRILTSAHVVSNQTFIQVRRFGETDKYIARVLAVGHDCDLALLAVEDKAFFKNTQSLELGQLPELGDKVTVYGFPVGGDKLSITEGVVSRIEVGRYLHSQRNLLTAQIDAAINPGNSGWPVVKDGKLVGVAFESIPGAENIGYTIPPLIISHFLHEVKDGGYTGFPMLGIMTQKLENDSYREYLGMAKEQAGVVVSQVVYGSSAWGIVKENDVVMKVDGIKVASDGTVPFGKRERLDLSYVISARFVGDTVSLEVLRDRKPMTLQMTLKGETDIISRGEYDVKPKYFIYGGLVFTNLTYNYLMIWNQNDAPPSLVNHYLYDIRTPERQEIVLLQSVLADGTNLGYHDFRSMVVVKVNGENISNMKDLISKIEKTSSGYLELETEGRVKIILDVARSRKASSEIMARYKIPYDKSEDLR
jgi:S1-C subfamily serine protease